MLLAMQSQPSVTATSNSARSDFAGMLSAYLASAPESEREPAPENKPELSNGDFSAELADDVSTISYERILRARAHYQMAGDEGQPLACKPETPVAASIPTPEKKSAELRPPAKTGKKNLKSASVTIRLSRAEFEQLQQRAAEAGVTVSGYLRSCTFEAEALRAQVKEALALMRSASTNAAPAPAEHEAAEEPHAVNHSWLKVLPLGWPKRLMSQALK
jgi:hypothetical protein